MNPHHRAAFDYTKDDNAKRSGVSADFGVQGLGLFELL